LHLNNATEILCIGNAIVDVFTNVAPSFLDRFGICQPVQHVGGDMAELILAELCIETNPGISGGINEEGAISGGVIIGSGGGAANVAKIAAMLGINTAFAGCAGQDHLAGIFENELTAAGVNVILSKGKEKTGVCFIFNTGAETRIAASPRAALELTETDIDETLFCSAKLVALDGYILERRPLVRSILNQTHKYGIPVAIDTASVFQIRKNTEDILHYSRNYPLLIFMNADEAIAFYYKISSPAAKQCCETGLSEDEKEKIVKHQVFPMLKTITAGADFPVFIVKLGCRGAAAIAGGNIYREETAAVVPTDSTGAGDAFCAAFLAARIRGKSPGECAALGNKVAGEILKVHGTGINKEKLKVLAEELALITPPGVVDKNGLY
jgi:sugar/nucleoside kinase (ribokinase family)